METPHAQPTRARRLERQHLRRPRPAQCRRPAAESPNRQRNLTADETEKTDPSQGSNIDRRGSARPVKPAARKIPGFFHGAVVADAHSLWPRCGSCGAASGAGEEDGRDQLSARSGLSTPFSLDVFVGGVPRLRPPKPLRRRKGGGGVSISSLPVILTRHPISSSCLRLRNPTDTSPSASARDYSATISFCSTSPAVAFAAEFAIGL